MTVQSWQVVTWPGVVAGVDEWSGCRGALRFMGASVVRDADDPRLLCGETVWGTEWNGQPVGMAWEWREVRPRVVAMGDPMIVLANVTFIEGAAFLDDGRRLLTLQDTIHQLRWQEPIAAALRPNDRETGFSRRQLEAPLLM